MNFFAHAVVASWHSHDPRFVLGAMLPDLLGMLGARLGDVHEPAVARGIELHHATDAAFHAAPSFTSLCSEAIARLTAEGVERGTARAVGHVGVELLLDGVLCTDAAARELYASALAAAGGGLSAWLSIAPPDALPKLTSGIRRLERAPIPEAYRQPEVVADRLRAILSGRPRLAMRPSDLEPVRAWAQATRPRVLQCSPELLAEVRQALPALPSSRAP